MICIKPTNPVTASQRTSKKNASPVLNAITLPAKRKIMRSMYHFETGKRKIFIKKKIKTYDVLDGKNHIEAERRPVSKPLTGKVRKQSTMRAPTTQDLKQS